MVCFACLIFWGIKAEADSVPIVEISCSSFINSQGAEGSKVTVTFHGYTPTEANFKKLAAAVEKSQKTNIKADNLIITGTDYISSREVNYMKRNMKQAEKVYVNIRVINETGIKNVTGIKARKKGDIIRLSWKPVKGCIYQIKYSTAKDMNHAVYLTIKKNKTIIKNLKKNKDYYIRIRACKEDKKGSWSKKLKVSRNEKMLSGELFL